MRIHVLNGLLRWLVLSCTIAAPAQSPPAAMRVDRVVVLKHERILQLYGSAKLLKSYKVALGTNPVGGKTRRGDHRTPEGNYILDSRNAHSQFHKSIHVSYPNARDLAIARSNHVAPGGDIFIHGLPNGYGWIGDSHRLKDWTDGCIAVTDQEMDEIWDAVPNGTPIEIRP